MNICCFSRINYWHGIKGGMDLHGKLLSEGLVRRGHQVTIISTRHPDGTEYEERNGVKIYYLKNTVFGSRRKGWTKESINKFFELHRRQPFDVIWSQSFDAFGLTRLGSSLKIPVIPTLHGSIEQEFKTFRTNIVYSYKRPRKIFKSFAGLFFSYFAAQKPLLSFSDKVITVSYQVAEDIKKWYGEKIADKCVVVSNGVDTSLFKPDRGQGISIRRKYGIDDHDILLLTLGRVTHEKGHHLAIEALKRLKNQDMNLRLLIVGDGENRKNLEENIRREGLEREVIFAGQIDNTETARYYNSADVFLMPTLTVEGLPFVLLEAMSCARPVIASHIGGNTSVIKDGKNGLMIVPGAVGQLADRIQLLVDDQSFANRLSDAARRTVLKDFSVDQMIDHTLRVMKKVADGPLL